MRSYLEACQNSIYLQSSQRGPRITHTKQNIGVFSQVWVGGQEDNIY